MFKGAINFVARLKGRQIRFPSVSFDPHRPGIENVEIEGPDGAAIRCRVHVAQVETPDKGRNLGAAVTKAALDRITFLHDVTIGNAEHIDDHFQPLNPQPGTDCGIVCTSLPIRMEILANVVSVAPDHLKAELEQASPLGERYFGMFRSACQSVSRVEEFMHLYHLLLMLCRDNQSLVDRFIVNTDPRVPQTRSPKKDRVIETIYTRLRNEFAHIRPGVNLEQTKAEIVQLLPALILLIKKAIQLPPYPDS